jgi:pyrimidine-nucleoside phosphorylase
MTNPVLLIRKKREGGELTREELSGLIDAYVRGDLPEYQMSAFLMATYFRGMTVEETLTFTDLMLRSGEVLDLSDLPGTKVDKHSTGGVGDKVSLLLAPMVAACGVPVPMISGRGLGHTGGTLDKLESIPGFRTSLDSGEYRRVLAKAGAVLAGQTETIVPADRKMYALRDVTATIECLPLIAGSIMSKKLAEGIDALVLDVKTGEGAFMEEPDRAAELARTLVEIGERYGKRTVAFLTAMDQPLGHAIGNWLEVEEAVDCLRGKQIPDLLEITTVLAGTMIWLGGKAGGIEEGMRRALASIWSGAAYEKFCEIVEAQGGDLLLVREPSRYPVSRHRTEVLSPGSGFVGAFATKRIGMLAVDLGAGRRKIGDPIDPKAGIIIKKKLGDRVERGEPVAEVRGENPERVSAVAEGIAAAITLSGSAPRVPPRIGSIIDAAGMREWVGPVVH